MRVIEILCFSPFDLYDINGGDGANELLLKNARFGTSLVAQWLRLCLPMQGTQVRALVWEDPTCHRATKPVRHNY